MIRRIPILRVRTFPNWFGTGRKVTEYTLPPHSGSPWEWDTRLVLRNTRGFGPSVTKGA